MWQHVVLCVLSVARRALDCACVIAYAVDDSQRLKVTHLRFPCQRRAPPLFKLSLILQ